MSVSSAPRREFGCRARVIDVGRWFATGQYTLVHAAAELNRSGEWALDGSRTCAHWIASALDVEVCTAREWIRIGDALTRLGDIDRAVADGRISYSKARTLTRVATVENQAELCDLAEKVPAGRLAAALAAWLSRREEPDDTEKRQQDARSVSWRVEPDGMVVGNFRLPPGQAALLTVGIDQQVLRSRPRRKKSTESDERASADTASPRTASKWPTIPQQRADGLIALISHRNRHGVGVGVTTEIVLHVRGDGCTLDDGTPISGSLIERIAPASFILGLIHDANTKPINASGRQRHPTTRQKRVVHERDRRCVDCGTNEFLEYDHFPDFDITHHTVVDELELRCWICHSARHATDRRERE